MPFFSNPGIPISNTVLSNQQLFFHRIELNLICETFIRMFKIYFLRERNIALITVFTSIKGEDKNTE